MNTEVNIRVLLADLVYSLNRFSRTINSQTLLFYNFSIIHPPHFIKKSYHSGRWTDGGNKIKKWRYSLLILVFFVCLILPVAAAGGKIAFSSQRDGYYEIFVMNADGTGQIRLTTNLFNDYEPSLSLDCSKIAFLSDRDGNPEIYSMNADGTG